MRCRVSDCRDHPDTAPHGAVQCTTGSLFSRFRPIIKSSSAFFADGEHSTSVSLRSLPPPGGDLPLLRPGQHLLCPGCAEAARKAGLRAAGRRYQRSRRGRLRHAERQRRYRARRQKVTHQGSLSSSSDDPLFTGPERPAGNGSMGSVSASGTCCHFCRRECAPFLRHNFLRRVSPAARSGTFSLPQAPT